MSACSSTVLPKVTTKGPVRYLYVQREYPHNFMEPQCRHQHPYRYRSPKWYKQQIPHDNYTLIKQWHRRNLSF
jgi:hypothetical protein